MAEQVRTGVWEAQAPQPGPEHRRLEVFIGRWITEGETVATPDAPSVKITASDIYEWVPGRFAVLHTAYGRIGEMDVGGVEMITYDPERGNYATYFFDSHGHVTVGDLIHDDGAWIVKQPHTRCTSTIGDDGSFHAAHEQSDDGVEWRPSMDVTLRKVE
jgi:Protein of unknown function (DUF1579)